MGVCSAILLILITLLFPPLGVFFVAGCGADLLINICLTILAYFPGHIHAFYLIWVYYDRSEQARMGALTGRRAPGIFSDKVQTGGHGYGTIVQPATAPPPPLQHTCESYYNIKLNTTAPSAAIVPVINTLYPTPVPLAADGVPVEFSDPLDSSTVDPLTSWLTTDTATLDELRQASPDRRLAFALKVISAH
ncbi:hypothetical protein B7463_g1075, partial [Scytalidium lignicola]